MRIVVLGYHNICCRCLEVLVRRQEDIAAVFTHQDGPNENIWFDSVSQLAETHNIPYYLPEDINAPEWISLLKTLAPDIIFSLYFRQMLSPAILNIPKLGAINMHGSLLPLYRGRCPVNWVLVKGEPKTGVTLHYMVEKPDAGDIIARKEVTIDFQDTALTLFKKMEQAAANLLDETLPLIKAGSHQKIPQDLSKGSYFGGRRPEDGKINWLQKDIEIYNLVRAVTHPYPGAFAFLQGKKLFIWECLPYQGAHHGKPGEIIAADKKQGLVIAAGQGAINITRCQIENNPEMTGQEFITQCHPMAGEVLT